MKKSPSGRVTISRSIYLSPEMDSKAAALAEHLGTDMNKVLKAVLQKGFDAPEIPEFIRKKLEAMAAAKKQTLSEFISELLIRTALDAPEGKKER